ncbi:MAG: flagellar hook-length control protein FliK [Magnetococcales bacterium]|nr:flagellar hook-length control protein FliK [Magnetococcales bacterium]
MIPLSMPLPDIQRPKPVETTANTPSQTAPAEEDFKEALDRAANEQESESVKKQPESAPARPEAEKTVERRDADLENQEERAATDPLNTGSTRRKETVAKERKDDSGETEQTSDVHPKSEEEEIEEALAAWLSGPMDGSDPRMALPHAPVPPSFSPGVDSLSVVPGTTGGGEGMSGLSRGAWVANHFNPIEQFLGGAKPGQTAQGRGGQEIQGMILEGGLNSQRTSGTGTVLQHATRPSLSAHSPTFGEDLAEQIGRIRMISRPGGAEQVRINLMPRELGSMDVRLSVDEENRVHLLITTESEAARELLNKQMPQLKEAFLRQNLGFGDIAVQVDQRQRGDTSGQGFEWREGRGGFVHGEGEGTGDLGRSEAPPRRPWSPGQGLSVFA